MDSELRRFKIKTMLTVLLAILAATANSLLCESSATCTPSFYRVCGRDKFGVTADFINECIACSAPGIVEYDLGSCDDQTTRTTRTSSSSTFSSPSTTSSRTTYIRPSPTVRAADLDKALVGDQALIARLFAPLQCLGINTAACPNNVDWVCGRLRGGTQIPFVNSCRACAFPNIASFTKGTCGGSPSASTTQQQPAPQTTQTTTIQTTQVTTPAPRPVVISQPVIQPIIQPIVQPVIQQAQPIAQPIVQPIAQPVTQPATPQVAQSSAQPVSQPTSQPAQSTPASQSAGQSDSQPAFKKIEPVATVERIQITLPPPSIFNPSNLPAPSRQNPAFTSFAQPAQTFGQSNTAQATPSQTPAQQQPAQTQTTSIQGFQQTAPPSPTSFQQFTPTFGFPSLFQNQQAPATTSTRSAFNIGPDQSFATRRNTLSAPVPCPDDISRYLVNCTRDYIPVCATNLDLSVKSYQNGCTACSNGEVIFYQQGTNCQSLTNQPPSTICTRSSSFVTYCTANYNPVCATSRSGATSTQSNGCLACLDRNVVGYRQGECRRADGLKPREALCGTNPSEALLCLLEWGPVCGQNAAGQRGNFPDGCAACREPTMVVYKQGKC